jgi:broad specificity phosphatase PhoE
MKRLYLARHGETDWNRIGRFQGSTDIPLNEEGRAQGRLLGQRARELGVRGLVSSDLSRAKETAELASSILGAPLVWVDPDLRERSYGVFEGRTRDECEAGWPEVWASWSRGPRLDPPGSEARPEVLVRVERAFERLRAFTEEQHPLLVVCHGGVMRMYLEATTGRHLPPVQNTAVYQVDYEGKRVVSALLLELPRPA